MDYLLAIDPGPTKSGVVLVDPYWKEGGGYRVVAAGQPTTDDVMCFVKSKCVYFDQLNGWVSDELINGDSGSFGVPTDFTDISSVVCEDIVSMGKFGGSLIHTCKNIGRMQEIYEREYGDYLPLISRRDEKKVLSKISGLKVKNDKTMCDAIKKIYPQNGGGKIPSVGVKKQPGPLYGVHGHAWQALAVAITFLERQQRGE